MLVKFPSKIRPSKDEYYLQIARQIAARSTCYRNRIGTIIIKEDQIIATGYVGAPRKTKDCFERKNCLRTLLRVPHGQRYEICRSVHSEQNAIINAARGGNSTLGGKMYIWGEDASSGKLIDAFPCFICKRMIINAGIEEVVVKTKKGQKVFKVKNWTKEWQKKDIIDDKYQYGVDRKIVQLKHLRKK
jgi:dCMP deaminase